MAAENKSRRQISARLLILSVLGLAVVAAISLLIFNRLTHVEPAASDPKLANVAVISDRIAKQCAMGRETEEQASVSATLARYLSGVSSGTTVKTSDVGALVDKIAPDSYGVEFYKAYTDCLKQQAAILLNQRGIEVEAPTAVELEDQEDEEVRNAISMLGPRAPKKRLIQVLGEPILEDAADDSGLTADFYQYKSMIFVADIMRNGDRVGLAFATKDPINGRAMFPDQFRHVMASDVVDECGGIEFTQHWNGRTAICLSSHATGYMRKVWFFKNYLGYVHSKDLDASCMEMIRSNARLTGINCPAMTGIPAMGVLIAHDNNFDNAHSGDLEKAAQLWIDILDFGGDFVWWTSSEAATMEEREKMYGRGSKLEQDEREAAEIEKRRRLVNLKITPSV